MTHYGPEVGYYGEKPIFDFIVHDGVRLVYNGVVSVDSLGQPVKGLIKEGDYLMGGRLIYSPERNLSR